MKIYKIIIKFILKLHTFFYRLSGHFSKKTEGGLHPKHRLMNYHKFFLDNIRPGDMILDIGCGNGALTYDLAKKAKKVIGIDLNKKNIKIAEEKYFAPNIKYMIGDATENLPDKRFDAIILSNVLEHIENRVEFLKKIKKTAPKILIRVPMINKDWITLYKKELGVEWRSDKTHYTEYTLKSFKDELNQAGLNLTDYSIQFGEIWAVILIKEKNDRAYLNTERGESIENTGNIQRPNAVIFYIAARKCLKKSLQLLYENFNNEYRYPVVVFTFLSEKKYSKKFIENIHKRIDPSIKFTKLKPPKIPSHIKEEELFYHRKEIPYVRNSFPKSRIGYLHMIQFVAGEVMKHPEIKKYDWVMRLDDDSFLVKKVGFDFFRVMREGDYKYGTGFNRKLDYERSRQCQIGLRELAKKYIKKYDIEPATSEHLDKYGNWDSICGGGDLSVYDLSIFRSKNWKNWWDFVYKAGGIYKYRWGDPEIHTLYMQIYFPDSAWHNFDLKKKGPYRHGGKGMVYTSLLKNCTQALKRKIIKILPNRN